MEVLYNGIDVSRWQGTIDWAAVKAAGIDFAFIRAGYCGYAGDMTRDTQFDANMEGAMAAGMDVGVYVYSYAKTADAAATAAKQTLAMVGGYRLTYPIAFDIEDTINVAMTVGENTAICKAFLSTIAAAGYCPLLYTFKSFAESKLDMAELADYDFWLAHITNQTSYTGPYTMWQHSWTGSVSGITGDVDLNRCYKDYPDYVRENGLNGLGSGDDDTQEDTGGSIGKPKPVIPCEPKDISYVVVKNDTLSHIAQRYGIPLRVLIQANPQIKNPNLIYVGDIITIPRKPKTKA